MLTDPFVLPLDPALINQTLPVFELQLRFRCLRVPGVWFVTAASADTGAPLAPAVPLVASYNARNDLFRPFHYALPYSLVCVPSVAAPSSADPGPDNLSEFAVVLGPA